jgi:hypothetical protein
MGPSVLEARGMFEFVSILGEVSTLAVVERLDESLERDD